MSAEARLTELGIELPTPFAPAGAYVPVVVSGGHACVSGQGPIGPSSMVTGKVGADVDVAGAKEAARLFNEIVGPLVGFTVSP